MLTEQQLEQIVREWSYWEAPPPPTIPRDVLSRSFPRAADLVTVIQGVRRGGKSTLLAQIQSQLQLSPQSCFFINFEDPRLSDNLSSALLDQIVALATKLAPAGSPKHFFFDEIQNVEDWAKWFQLRLAKPKAHHFVVTGSNSSLLSGELGSLLTGRHLTVELFPFNFGEYRLARPEDTFESFLDSGGFPRPLSFHHPQQLLREYLSDIVERDVRRHVAARSSLVLTQLVKAVYESAGSEISQRALASMLGVSADTIGEYLSACESAYLILSCPYFTYSEKQRAARNRKLYPIDLGLRNAVITRGGQDRGKALETVVFHHLRRHFPQVFYWRDKGEVDFIVVDGSVIRPFQVSWDGPKERHIQALEEFRGIYPQAAEPIFITRENVEAFLRTPVR